MRIFGRGAWIAAIVMFVGYLGTLRVREGYTFEVVPLHRELESLPLVLDEWHGADVPMADDGTREILNAQSTVNRVYQNRDGVAVSLNVSAWLRPETVSAAAPHIPKICYANAGWSIVEEREVLLNTSTGDIPLVALLLERGDQRIVVAYWYQMGESYFTSVEDARRIHRLFWGQPRWPATFKVLIQTTARRIEAGLPPIEQIALLLQREMTEVSGDSER